MNFWDEYSVIPTKIQNAKHKIFTDKIVNDALKDDERKSNWESNQTLCNLYVPLTTTNWA